MTEKNLQPKKPNKILVLIGPTASGKSELGVSLAKEFNGEIISADSRQVYKGMDLGTGKVAGSWIKTSKSKFGSFGYNSGHSDYVYVYKNVIHHCIDFVNPKVRFSVARFQKITKKIIADILKRGKLPILLGGTGHWIDAVIFNQSLPKVKPNPQLRKSLEKESAETLYSKLTNLDPVRASTIDKFNKRRLIRALEIVITTGKPVPILSPNPLALSTLWLATTLPQQILYKKIEKRLKERFKLGMIKEVEKLKKSGLSYKRLESFGLEYKFIALYLQKKITYKEMEEKLLFAIKHYSKRQLTWWKKNKNILWIEPNFKKSVKLVEKFLK